MLSIDNPAAVSAPFHKFFAKESVLVECLYPMLRALDWQGTQRQIAESLPHFSETLDITSYRKVMQTLGFKSKCIKLDLASVNSALFPCLFVSDDGKPLVLLSRDQNSINIFNPENKQQESVPVCNKMGRIYVFLRVGIEDELKTNNKRSWFGELCIKHKGIIYQLLGVGFFINLFAIASSLFVMVVYDKVIGNGSISMLWGLGIGMLFVLTTSFLLSRIRAKMMAFIGAKIDLAVGSGILQRLLHLPSYYIENTTVGAQVSRVKDFDSVREFFTGQLFSTLFDLPYVLLYMVVILCLGGPIVLVPVLLVIAYLILFYVLIPMARRRVDTASEMTSKRQRFLVESFDNIQQIKSTGAEREWGSRYRDISADSSLANYRSGLFNSILSAFADASVVVGVSSILVWGVNRVLEEEMTVGALIACMILIWKVLGPIRTVFTALPRLEQTKAGIDQINNLMRLQPETDPSERIAPLTEIKGNINIEELSFRYSNESDSALRGVSLQIKEKQLIAITGNNGSGKSTLFKMLLAMYPMQSGTILLEGTDMRQFDLLELRHSIAYVPQTTDLFYGTIEQNIRLANPVATAEQVEKAMRLAGLDKDVDLLHNGLETQIMDQNDSSIPSSIIRKVALARAYVKDSKLILLDEPATGLDDSGDKQFLAALDELRKHKTILMITHRPSHMKVADRVVVLQDAEIAADASPDEILPKLMPNASKG